MTKGPVPGMSLATAFLLDLLAGEPGRCHPVRAMGAFLDVAAARRARGRPERTVVEGAATVTVGSVLFAVAGSWTTSAVRRLLRFDSTLARALLLKPTFSVRELVSAGRGVRRALEVGDLDRARRRAGRDLVGRRTADLSSEEVASAAVESLAENLCDSVVAPLLWAGLAGPGGAYAYRFLNTADAMIGYRTPEFGAYGRFAARADDLANLLPARLTAGFVALAGSVVGGGVADALRVAVRDAGRTASPNAGWPMAAMAGALGVRLGKRGHYVLNGGGRRPGPETIARAEVVVALSSAMALGTAILAARWRGTS